MKRLASEVINELESRISNLENKIASSISEIEGQIAQIKDLYLAGVLTKQDYFKYLNGLQDKKDAIERSQMAEDPSKPKVGDILYSSWGYSMTIVDFYKVVKVSPSGKSVSVQKLQDETVSGDAGYEGYVMPTKYEETGRDTFFKNKRVSPYGNGYMINITRHQQASTWDGKKKYFNRMD